MARSLMASFSSSEKPLSLLGSDFFPFPDAIFFAFLLSVILPPDNRNRYTEFPAAVLSEYYAFYATTSILEMCIYFLFVAEYLSRISELANSAASARREDIVKSRGSAAI